MLRGPIGLPREKAPVDRPCLLGAALVGLCCVGKDVVAHVLPKHLRLPAERSLIEFRHPLAVVVRHFKVHDGIHALLHIVCVVIPLRRRVPERGALPLLSGSMTRTSGHACPCPWEAPRGVASRAQAAPDGGSAAPPAVLEIEGV